ncbi:unnamed protein product [Lupinus luteus]|uniref:SAC domain-containing protein n=1 Tax=Lupinus luteus TaxID=3873 RepID=A0AAV1Y2R8_LUPLU
MDIEPSSDSPERFKLYDELELLEFQDKFVIKSHQSSNQGFWINRSDGNINLLDGDTNLESPSKTSTIYGVVGTIRLVVGTYAIVITSRKEVGTFLGFPVYHLTSMRVLACNEALRFATGQEKKDEAYFTTLLKAVESMPGLYYSYETDVTLSLQIRSKLVGGWMRKPIWKQADPRFVWNRHLLEELIECKLDRFIIPLLQGSFQKTELKVKDTLSTVTLISRRCTRRLGTRMWRRGANLDGDTANFIETEQLLEIEDFRSSFLQVRGSIPILWEQIVDLSYKPHLRVISHEQTPNIVTRHFNDLKQRYGEIMAVDLTDKHGEEGQLSAAYAAEMRNQQNVRYGLSRYFLIDSNGTVLEEQKGIVRENCIDSLDRTNVTQDALDLISGHYNISRNNPSLQQNNFEPFSMTDSNVVSSFEAFFHGWLMRQRSHLDELLSAQQQLQDGDRIRELINRVLCHYGQYYEEKSKVAQNNIILVFSPPWFSSLERMFLWVGGFKPGMAFEVVNKALEDGLSEEQKHRLSQIQQETKLKERELNDELAKVHESVAAPPLVEMARSHGKMCLGVPSTLKVALENLVVRADGLRRNTALKVVQVLKPAQAVTFFAAVAELQLRVRAWGLEKDGLSGG